MIFRAYKTQTFFTIDHVGAFERAFNLDCYFFFVTFRFSGIGINNFNRALLRSHHVFYNRIGRVWAFDCVPLSIKLRVLCIYGRAQEELSNNFNRDLDVYFLGGRHVILAEDFNCTCIRHVS